MEPKPQQQQPQQQPRPQPPKYDGPKPNQLPSRRSVEDAIKVIEGFQAMCRHQMDLGYWATVDFPSKHHIGKILQMEWRDKAEVYRFYGDGLARHIYELLPVCQAYTRFLRNDRQNSK